MGFFGVLSDEGTSEFVVSKLDLNLWCLPAFPGRHVFFCDLGVEITPAGGSLARLSLALPFKASRIQDLARYLKRSDVAGLIFGEPVDILRGGDSIKLKNDSLRVASIDENATKLDQDRGGGSSLCHLVFDPPLPASAKSYSRVRFDLNSLGRLWVWNRSFGTAKGAVADIRVADLREAALLGASPAFAARIVSVATLNCFVIVPVSFRRLLCSPEVRYLRLLEANVWREYLPRRCRSQKLLVHFWREKNVTIDHEFRGLLALEGPSHRARAGALLAAAASAAFAVLLLASPTTLRDSALVQAASWLLPRLSTWWAGVLVVLVPLLWWVLGNLDTARTLLDKGSKLFRRERSGHGPSAQG